MVFIFLSGFMVERTNLQCYKVNMKRRQFLKTSLVASAAATTSVSNTAETKSRNDDREFYELRQYHLRQGPMLKRFDDFYRDIAVPAWNRAGVSTVGVFDVMIGPDHGMSVATMIRFGVATAGIAAAMPATGPPPAGDSGRNVTGRATGRSGPDTITGMSSGNEASSRSRAGVPSMGSAALSTPPSRCPLPPARTMTDQVGFTSAACHSQEDRHARSCSQFCNGLPAVDHALGHAAAGELGPVRCAQFHGPGTRLARMGHCVAEPNCPPS